MADWFGRRVVIIGAARQGIALARYLARHGARVLVNDRRPAEQLSAAREALAGEPVEWALGGHKLEVLEGADLLCPSGGVPLTLPLVEEARRRGIPLSNDSQIFLEMARCRVVGITGSAGKTTTTTLVGRMAEKAIESYKLQVEGQHQDDWKDASVEGGQRLIFHSSNLPTSNLQPYNQSWIGGNIGTPLIEHVDEMQVDDLAVMELSSFQLELMTRSPQVAAVLNITPNHLDRHASMQAYTAAKARILAFQGPEDAAVLGLDDPGAWQLAGEAHGQLISFGLSVPPEGQPGAFLDRDGQTIVMRTQAQGRQEDRRILSRQEIALRGEHNLLNVVAACAIAWAAGLPCEAMRAGVSGFGGVPHRLEFVRTWGGADWYNDSIATSPERAMAAMRSFEEPLVLLAGGRDKDLPWEDFASLASRRVHHLILFGEAAGKIQQAMEAAANPSSTTVIRCSGLREAIAAAARVISRGDVVLLSPGGTSFDEFRDFEDRGEAYRQWVLELL